MSLHDRIAVVDFGGQYAHLIATKVRRQRVLAEIRQPDDHISAFAGMKGVILSGSPSLASGDEGGFNQAILDLDVPILGFCFGHQEIAKRYGGKVEHCRSEYGPARLEVTGADAGVRRSSERSDRLDEPPGHGRRRSATGSARSASRTTTTARRTALRRSPTKNGGATDSSTTRKSTTPSTAKPCCAISCSTSAAAAATGRWSGSWRIRLRRFAARSARARCSCWRPAAWIRRSARACSARRSGPDQLHLLHVDNGLMRKDESRLVIEELHRFGLGRHLNFVDASDRFLTALDGVIEPERKRRIIGDTFIRVFEDEMRRLDLGDMLLAQGTIYPDTIETGGTKRADTIKTHHNRVPIIEEMIQAGRVVEPIRELYKVEVREMAEALGIARRAGLAASVSGAGPRRPAAVFGRPRAGRPRSRAHAAAHRRGAGRALDSRVSCCRCDRSASRPTSARTSSR